MSPGPDETNFKNMEVVAQAAGPEAEARRQEMARWSEAQGAHAEEAAATQSAEEAYNAQLGLTHEKGSEALASVNQSIAANGVTVRANRHGKETRFQGNNDLNLRASETGITTSLAVDPGAGGRLDRSPASIGKAAEKARTESLGEGARV